LHPKIDQFINDNFDKLQNALFQDPEKFCLGLFEANAKLFSLNFPIEEITPLDGPIGMVFYMNYKTPK
jgi:hypothetical protein